MTIIDPHETATEVKITSGSHSTAPPWDVQTMPIVAVAFGLLVIALVFVVRTIIPFMLTVMVFSYLLTPIVDLFDRWITRGKRGLAVLLTYLLIVVVILTVLLMIFPPLISQTISGIVSVWETVTGLVREPIMLTEETAMLANPETGAPVSILDFINLQLEEQGFGSIDEFLTSPEAISIERETLNQFFTVGGGLTSSLLGSVFTIAGSTIAILLNFVFFVTATSFLLSNGRSMLSNVINVVPDGYQGDVRRLLVELGGVWHAYVRGNITLGVIMGGVMYVIAIVFGLPNPLFLGLVAGLVELIPNIGPTIALIVAVTLTLVSGSTTFPELNPLVVAGLVTVIWMVMQNIESTVLVPRIVGGNLKLHPVVVILAIIWGGSFGGLLGVVIAPPLIASARIILHYLYGRLTGRTSFDDSSGGDALSMGQWWQRARRRITAWVRRLPLPARARGRLGEGGE